MIAAFFVCLVVMLGLAGLMVWMVIKDRNKNA